MSPLVGLNKLILIGIASILLATISSVAMAEVASGTVYYVATTGNDGNAGAIDKPLRTIQAAIDKTQPGDTVYVRGGVYHERVVMKTSGTATQPIRILAYENELPVIDGEYILPDAQVDACDNSIIPPRCKVSQSLIRIRASHIVFDGFKITQSLGTGILVGPTATEHVTIRNCQIHEMRSAAIGIENAYHLTVEGCDIFHAGNFAPYDRSSREVNWPPTVKAKNSTYLIYRNNTIRENWGEGLSAGVEVSNVWIEDNIVFNNFALQLYINRSSDVVVQRNLIYHTNDPDFRRGGNPSQCISLNNEVVEGSSITVNNIKILNNVITGCSRNIGLWGGVDPASSFENISIKNNVLVNAHTNDADPAFGLSIVKKASMRNVEVLRNIILQDDGNVGRAPADAELSFSQNLWSQTPPSTMVGSGDFVADPLLANATAPLVAGTVEAEWYMPLPSSPAVEHGMGPFEILNQAVSMCCQVYLPLVTND